MKNKSRFTKECPSCYGKGFHYNTIDGNGLTEDCERCNGTGRIAMSREEIDEREHYLRENLC